MREQQEFSAAEELIQQVQIGALLQEALSLCAGTPLSALAQRPDLRVNSLAPLSNVVSASGASQLFSVADAPSNVSPGERSSDWFRLDPAASISVTGPEISNIQEPTFEGPGCC